MAFNIIDSPMSCCGMVIASGFNEAVFPNWPDTSMARWANTADTEKRFQELQRTANESNRSCQLIVLSDAQRDEIEVAKKQGFKTIETFYNPNSGNYVHIMTKVAWQNRSDYHGDDDDEDND